MRSLALTIGVLSACNNAGTTGNSSASETHLVSPPEAVAPPVPGAITPSPDANFPPGPIPPESTQLIISLSDGWTGIEATLIRYERESDGPWLATGEPVVSTLGHAGLGWGRGLHENPSEGEPIKHEGDGRSPAGVFSIGHAYGYAPSPAGTALSFQQVDKQWRCVNDTKSTHYNRVLDMKTTTKDWDEAERMLRRDELYELVIEVDHNHIVPASEAPTPGDGSCIFLHVWRRPGAPTIGCTAMPLAAMQELLAWLRPEASPVLVALPAARYESLRTAWQLPPAP